MNPDKIYDFIAIGIGPFNLGLAALTSEINKLNGICIDKNKTFDWHPGLMLPHAKMQVPFYADLVTLADPTSKYSYINYLKESGRLFRFAINENYFPYRSEYNDYCQWVGGKLDNLYFGQECKSVSYDSKQKLYYVTILNLETTKVTLLTTKNIIVGVGSTPSLPEPIKNLKHTNIFHAADYLKYKDLALMHKNIMLVGSGQSAAEIFQDLLPYVNDLDALKWYTRSDRFYAMDYSKFALEMSSPEYIRYFYDLPKQHKPKILQSQHDLYKGINRELIDSIYAELCRLSLHPKNKLPVIKTNMELVRAEKIQGRNFVCVFKEKNTGQTFTTQKEVIILATGYEPASSNFLDGITQHILMDENGQYDVKENYSIDKNNTVFLQNAEWHSHGFNSADLGLGPYRNAVIINAMMGKEYYALPLRSTFQSF